MKCLFKIIRKNTVTLTSLAFLLFSFSSFSEIKVTNITGASSSTFDASGVRVIAGLNGGCASSPTTTCNSCLTPKDSPGECNGTTGELNCCGGKTCFTCNEKAVVDSTVLTIYFTSDAATSGTVRLKGDGGTFDSTTVSGSGGTFIYTRPWSDICTAISNCSCSAWAEGGSCRTDVFKTADLTLEVDGTTDDSATIKFDLYHQDSVTLGTFGGTVKSDALSNFFIYPGDEKVYIEEPTIGVFTSLKAIYFFIGTPSFQSAYSTTKSNVGVTLTPAVQTVDSDGTIAKVIDGLENSTTYHFRPASVDVAGNVYNVMDDKYIQDSGCVLTEVGGGNNCRFAGTPSKVLGMLTEDLNCFVATAAYGSSLDPHIDTFREFRYKVLLRSEFGKKLNWAYYNFGPKMARSIIENPWLRPVSRAILWPAWGLASISLYFHFSLWQSLAFFAFTLFVTVGLISLLTHLALKPRRKRA
ncbi:hypothetical protein GW916_06075 [bacterium]|nr:hypothetical protein [bacterium]